MANESAAVGSGELRRSTAGLRGVPPAVNPIPQARPTPAGTVAHRQACPRRAARALLPEQVVACRRGVGDSGAS
jgi:hypothetical protein